MSTAALLVGNLVGTRTEQTIFGSTLWMRRAAKSNKTLLSEAV